MEAQVTPTYELYEDDEMNEEERPIKEADDLTVDQ